MSLLTQAEGGSQSSDSWVQLPISQAQTQGHQLQGCLPAPTTNTFSGRGDSLASSITSCNRIIGNSGTKSMIGLFSSVKYSQARA